MEQTLVIFRDLIGCEVMSDEEAEAEDVRTINGIDARVRFVYLRAPGGRVFELLEYYGPPDRRQVVSRPCDPGAAHVAFRVDDVEAAVAAGARAGLSIYNRVFESPGVKSAYTHGPDGLGCWGTEGRSSS